MSVIRTLNVAPLLKLLWPCHTSATDRVPGCLVGRFCALVWPARKAARPVTIVFRHLIDQQGRLRSGGTRNSSRHGADAQGAEAGTCYIGFRVRENSNACNKPTCYLRIICRWAVTEPQTSPELPQWNPLASLVNLCTVNFLNNCYAIRYSPNGSLVPSAPSHI